MWLQNHNGEALRQQVYCKNLHLIQMDMIARYLWLSLFHCVITSPIICSDELDAHLRDLVNNPLDSLDVVEAERAYQDFVQVGVKPDQCEEWHRATATLLMAELRGLNGLYLNSTLMDLEANAANCTAPQSIWWDFILASAYFVTRDYEQAALHYTQIPKSVEDATTFWLYVKAQNNLASSYNGMQQLDEAIQTFESLTETLQAADETLDLDSQTVQDFHQMITINLGGLLVSARDYEGAEALFSTLDGTEISNYWDQIIAINRLLIYQETGMFARADSLWVNHVRSIPHSAIQSTSFRSFLRQAVLSDDAVAFKALSAFILNSQPEVLLSPNYFFTPLVRASQDPDDFEAKWPVYKTWEAERTEFVVAYLEERSENTSARINELNAELSERDSKIEFWQQMLMFSCAGALLVLLAYLLLKRQQIKASQRELESVLAPNPNAERKEQLELKLDDVRTLGDAITQGKRTADAMLILQKMSLWLMPAHQSDKINLESLEHYDQLTASEQKILNDLLSGFEAKEIARMMKVSPPYIYNSRSHIRRKLEIPKSMSIEDFVISRAEKINQYD